MIEMAMNPGPSSRNKNREKGVSLNKDPKFTNQGGKKDGRRPPDSGSGSGSGSQDTRA